MVIHSGLSNYFKVLNAPETAVYRNVVVSVVPAILIFIICSGCTPAPRQLYKGEKLSREKVSVISDGSNDSSPLEGHGWFRPVKIDGSDIPNIPVEVLPGDHTLEVTYNWWTKTNYTAVVATIIPATAALCFVTAGISCGLGIVIPGYYPPFDMSCQSNLEFHTEEGRNYLVKTAAIGNNVEDIMQNTSLVIADADSNQTVATSLMQCARGKPGEEQSGTNRTRNPLTP